MVNALQLVKEVFDARGVGAPEAVLTSYSREEVDRKGGALRQALQGRSLGAKHACSIRRGGDDELGI